MSNRWFVGKKRGLMHAADPRFPWLSCQFPDKIAHFGKNHTFTHAPPLYCSSQGAKMCPGSLCTVMQRGFSLALEARTLFGTIWQLRELQSSILAAGKYDLHRSVAASLMYSSSESGTESQGVCNLRQGWKVRSCSIDAQSFGNQAQYINLCPAGGNSLAIIFIPS